VNNQSSFDESRRRHPSGSTATSSVFANPSERVFANLLDLYGIKWVYEPIEFPLAWNGEGEPTKAFRPDFYLPERNSFIELTVLLQRNVTRKNKKIRRFRVLYPEVELVVVYQRGFNELLARHGLDSGVGHAA
jgi:hypothetical protein